MKLGRILWIQGALIDGAIIQRATIHGAMRSCVLASGALSGLLASGCGSSSTTTAASTAPGGDGGASDGAVGEGGVGAPNPGTFGALCAESQACTSGVCLRFTSNAQQAAGICSMLCPTTGSAGAADDAGSGSGACGGAGACVSVAVLDGGACYPTCSAAAECAGGLPCVWNQSLGAGLCQPLPLSFCTEIAALGSCEKCLGASCCGQVTTCAEDVGCSKLEAACPGNSACSSALQASGEVAAQALGSCAATSCAADCQ